MVCVLIFPLSLTILLPYFRYSVKKLSSLSNGIASLPPSYRSVFAREGLGYLLTFRHLIDTSGESGLVFRPLEPALETSLYIAWNRYQAFTPIAERFLKQLKKSFFNAGK